ncbi:hypothetical protein [Roseibium sp.]|uniref:hypothetical protein n=1 Tax=Roseibium sp. TaxID=1936156 RepID=UPI003B503357
MKPQTLAAIPIAIAATGAILLGFEEPFGVVILLQFPLVGFLFVAGVAATVCFGFVRPAIICGIAASVLLWFFGARPDDLLLIGLVAFAVPYAFVQLLSDAVRYILRFGRNLKNT